MDVSFKSLGEKNETRITFRLESITERGHVGYLDVVGG
jgi:hypothetical protein